MVMCLSELFKEMTMKTNLIDLRSIQRAIEHYNQLIASGASSNVAAAFISNLYDVDGSVLINATH